jgi:hypothetical protein
MHFKPIWIVLVGIFLSYLVNATEVCRDCRSMDLQLAPGTCRESYSYTLRMCMTINANLALGWRSARTTCKQEAYLRCLYLNHIRTSAAALANGTIIDLDHLPGSDEYRALMRNTAIEAEGIRDGAGLSRLVQACVLRSCSPRPRSWMPWLNELGYQARWRHEHPILAYLSDHYPNFHSYLSAPPTPLLNADDRVQTLVQELTRFKALSETELGTLINETSISFPSITKLLGQSFAGYIRQSLDLADFLVTTDSDGIAVQHAALSTVEITGPTLGLEYGDAVLCLSMQLPNTEQPEYPHLERVGFWAALGSGFENTTGHWERLTFQVEDFLANLDPPYRSITQVLVTSNASASNAGLYQVIANIFPDIEKSPMCAKVLETTFLQQHVEQRAELDRVCYLTETCACRIPAVS